MAELNPFKIAQEQLDAAAARLGLDRATHELLRWPQQNPCDHPRTDGRREDQGIPWLPDPIQLRPWTRERGTAVASE